MKYVFFGTPDVASETLERLLAAGLRPAAVVTNPDAPRGRGHVSMPSPVRELAESVGLPVLIPEKLDQDTIEQVGAVGADLAIVVAYGKILPEELIASFPLGVLNVHYSLLPRWRGASPMESALLHGDAVTGVTIQRMVKRLDAGDIISVESMEVFPEDTALTLRPRLIELGADLLVRTLPRYMSGEIFPVSQDETKVTYAPKYSKEDGLIDLGDADEANWRKYRAFAASAGTYFFQAGKRMKIKKASWRGGRFVVERVVPEGGKETDYRPT